MYRSILAMFCVCFMILACSEEGADAPVQDAPDTAAAGEEPPPPSEGDNQEPALNAIPSAPPTKAVDDDPVPTEAECNAALASMESFTEKIGQKPPKKKERKEFLKQCENWPRASVQCLQNAVEPPEVLECMKPIAEQEMKREIVKAKKTVPTKGTTDKTLAPKKVKKRGGAAARRMESFKKAVGKE